MKRPSPQADTLAAWCCAEIVHASRAMQNLAAHVERERAAAQRDVDEQSDRELDLIARTW